MKHSAFAVALFVVCATRPSWAADRAQGDDGRKPAAEQARIITEAGLRQELQSHKGRPVILHFWATWCGPCLSELPALARMAQEVERRGIDFVAVSLDRPDSRSAQKVSAVLAQRVRNPHWSSIVKIVDVNAFIDSIDPDWDGSIPAFFAFDGEARLRRSHRGNITREELERLIAGLGP